MEASPGAAAAGADQAVIPRVKRTPRSRFSKVRAMGVSL
jgi:hypothetical protein